MAENVTGEAVRWALMLRNSSHLNLHMWTACRKNRGGIVKLDLNTGWDFKSGL